MHRRAYLVTGAAITALAGCTALTGDDDTGANFIVTVDFTNSPVPPGETLDVDATIENTGDESGQQNIRLEIDGDEEDSESLSLNVGDSDSVSLAWETSDAGEFTASVLSDNDEDSVEVEVGEPGVAEFSVSIVDSPTATPEGSLLEVGVEVENVGGGSGEQDIRLEADDNEFDSQSVSLDAGEREEVTLEWRTEESDAGSVVLTVRSDDDEVSHNVQILTQAHFEVEIDSTNSPVEMTDVLEVTSIISNTGQNDDEQDIHLEVNGSEVDSQALEVAGENDEEITLEWETTENDIGDHSATVVTDDDEDSIDVEVTEPPPDYVVIEDFEREDPLQEYYGNTDNFSIVDEPYEGTQALRGDAGFNTITSVEGLPTYPEAGGTFSVQWLFTHPEVVPNFHFGVDGEQDDRYDLYDIGLSTRDNELELRVYEGGESKTLFVENEPIPIDEWLTMVVDWGEDGQIDIEVTDEDGAVIVAGSATDDTYTEGGVGFRSDNDTYWDHVRLLEHEG